jgi:hypothetical protein
MSMSLEISTIVPLFKITGPDQFVLLPCTLNGTAYSNVLLHEYFS